MSDRHMNARPKRLTRKQKEALSAQDGIPACTSASGMPRITWFF